jgi:malate dehydrogenase (oxaloacetate-decarboxylating)
MILEGISETEAKSLIWLIDSRGLVHTARTDLEPSKRRYAQPVDRLAQWKTERAYDFTFTDVIDNVRPTILIGTSAQPGAFSEQIVREMARQIDRPIIFPLSNPTSKCEATPRDILRWTNGRALVATGSPFRAVRESGKNVEISQCNNALIFPGVGLGVLATRARRVTEQMFLAAAFSLSELSPALRDPSAALYPPLECVREISGKVALAVGKEAQRSGLAKETSLDELNRRIAAKVWEPDYLRLVSRDDR